MRQFRCHRHHGKHERGRRGALGRADGESAACCRTVWLTLAALDVTALLQVIIVLWSGSVALLADTLRNIETLSKGWATLVFDNGV